MKIKFQYIFIIAFSAAGISGFAQVTGTRNYVSTNIVKAPGTNTQAQVNALTATGKQSVITYFDGLGRPLQQVAVQQSPAQKDVITPVSYDGYGREIKKYLPYTDNAGTAYGSLHTAAYTEQSAFYSPSTSMPDVARDASPYAQSFLEFSPSGRMIEQGAEGVTWQPGSGKTVQPLQSVNTAAEQVRRWTITGTTNAVLPTTGATYGNGELLKAVMKDENGKTTITYTDKERKTILKKVQLSASPGITHTGWLCTYYIYDDLNNLRFVLQPKAVELIDPSWVLDADIAYGLCFQYTYDKKGRMITKKMPDADPVYMVYDIRDRLVMTQDGKQRATSPQTWLVTLYDGLNRPVQTGHINTNYSKLSGKTLDQILEDAADQVDYPFALTTPPSGSQYTLFTQTGYDDYDGMSAAGSPLTKDFDNTYNISTYLHTTYNTSPLYAQQLVQSFQTRGLPTWTKVKIAGVNYFEYTVNIYDDKERVIQTKRRNYTGGTSITTTQYNWVGQPLRIVQKHTKTLNTVHNSIVITDLSYDHAGRVTEMKKKIRNNLVNSNQLPAEWTVIASNQYNAIGQLIAKDLGKKRNTDGTYSAAPLAKLGYGYNIRGWLLSINKPYMDSTNADAYFAMELGYDKDPSMGSFTGKQYNGNISSMLWKSEGDQQRRKYNFTYDAANRLTAADFGQWVSGSGGAATFNTSANVNYSVSGIQYDANGNLTAMKQHGLKLNASVPVDDLLYEVKSKSNRLRWVKDQGIPAGDNGKLGDFKDGANADNTDDYSYNPNGSITMDKNRDISSITYYATIELPNVITTPKGTIEYVYDVLGNKSWKKTTDNSISGKSISTSTKYLEGFVYETKTTTPADAANPDYTDKLQFTAHEEGRIRALYNNASTPNTPTGFAYDYFLKDHLGNVRMVLTDEVKQNIYPAATLEGTYNATGTTQTASMINYEKQFYNIDNTKVVLETDILSWPTETVANTKLYYNNNGNPPTNGNYPAGTTPVQTDGSTKLYRLNATSNKTGLEFVVKVMAGDRIDILGKSYYLNTTPVNNANSSALDLLGLMTNMLLGPTNPAGGKGFTASLLNTTNTGLVPATFFRGNNGETGGTVPKAYINYLLFDEQFKYVGGNFSRAGTSGVVKNHFGDGTMQNISVTKNGYIFVYVSNESNLDVFFDNLQVIHTRSAILEETHYYPFGLTMAGISSKALAFGEPENKYKFNGIEQSNDFDLNMYDAFYRNLDPQIGRFWQIDPKIESFEALSPYVAMMDNPIRYSDPLGDSTIPGAGFFRNLWEGVKDGGKETKNFISSLGTTEGWKNLVTGVAGAVNMVNGSSPEAVMQRAQFGGKIVEGVQNIPNMSSDELGHAVGYGAEKIGEAVLLSKGAGMMKNAVAGAKTAETLNMVNPSTLVATENGITWTKSTQNVASIMNSAKDVGITRPIDVFLHNGKSYIVNGHHRVHAASRLGIDVPVNYVSSPGNYSNVFEIQNAAAKAAQSSFKVDGRLLKTLLK